MAKLIAGLGALLVYGSLGAASAIGGLHDDAPESSGITGYARTEIVSIATADTTALPMGETSDEEKERRKQVCEREFEHCYDWCSRSKKTKSDQRHCYEEECYPKLSDCMKRIPY